MKKPGDNLLYFDGTKSTPLSQITNWDAFLGGPRGGDVLDSLGAYQAVPWLFRAVDLRAKAMQKMPLGLYKGSSTTDLSEDDAYAPLMRRIRTLLFLDEAALCLHARTYWVLETNVFGANLTPRWVVPTTVEPKFTGAGDVARFVRHVNGQQLSLAADQVRAAWTPSLTADVGPGQAPAAVALRSAGVLHHLDAYLAAYFERGAIRATLLQIDGNPPKGEKDKLEAWWKRMLGGVKKAYETVAISAAVKPIVIGDSLKETVNKDLTEQERTNIATALGVPVTLMNAIAANYATAQQDWVNLYDQTILPDCELLEGPINEQYLARLGLRLDFEPDRLPCYQAAFLEKATAVQKLVPGRALLTVDEGRAILGYEPSPELMAAAAAPKVVAPPAPATGSKPVDKTVDESVDTAKMVDLDKWERKALKRIGQAVSFESAEIPAEDQAAIAGALGTCSDAHAVKHLFAAYKKVEELSEAEQRLYDALAPVFTKRGRDALKAIIAGEIVNLQLLDADLKAALLPILVEHVLEQAGELAETIGPDFDPAEMATAAGAWAEAYTFDLVKGITATTQQVLQKAVASYATTPGMSRGQLEALLRPAFGAKRAESIAITEITRADNQATLQYQRYLKDAGIVLERVWSTNADDTVCAVCGPLNGTTEADWGTAYPNGAPAHPRCRCVTSLEAPRG